MEDFRYATILSLFAQKVEVDYQYCKVEEDANPKNIMQSKTDQNTMSQMTEPKVYETQTNDAGHNTMHQHIWNPPVVVLDHNYAKTTDFSREIIHNSCRGCCHPATNIQV